MSKKLIIETYRNKIVKAINTNRVILVRGQTGCGKSTQIPQYILEDIIRSNEGTVQVLLPRTVTTSSLATYMSEKLKSNVSCNSRFNHIGGDHAKLKYMTIGWFLNNITNNKGEIKRLRYVIIDDVNERSIETDIVLGKMQEYLRDIKELKLIIMSALFNVEAMKSFYNKFKLCFIDIPREPFDIKIRYESCLEEDYVNKIVRNIIEISINDFSNKKKPTKKQKSRKTFIEQSSHILVFLPTESKVITLKEKLKEAIIDLTDESSSMDKECLRYIQNIEIHKVFSNMVPEEKERLFKSQSKQKVIISTNVLENGLTIPDLKYVIDCGRVSRVKYDNKNNAVITAAGRISVAEAEQRKGLLVRNNGGTCIRIYENPFSLIFPVFIQQKIDELNGKNVEKEKLSDFSCNMKNKEFLDMFCNDLHSYFEISVDETHVKERKVEENELESLRSILNFIYPGKKLNDYQSIIEFIVHEIMNAEENFMVDEKKNIEIGVLPPPNVPHCDYMQLIVRILGLGENDIFKFPFLDKPDEEELDIAAERLIKLSIIERKKNHKYELTRIGKEIVKIPLDPRMAKVVYMAKHTIFGGKKNLYFETVYISALERMNSLLIGHKNHKFDDEHGDLFKLLNIWYLWLNRSYEKKFCKSNGLNYSNLCYAYEVTYQLKNKKYKGGRNITINNNKPWCWLGMLLMCGYSHNIAVKTDTKCDACINEEKEKVCQCLYKVLYSGCEAVIDRKSCLQKFREYIPYNTILFLTMSKSATDKQLPFRLRNIISLDEEDIFQYPISEFKVHRDLWRKYTDNLG